MTGTTSPITTAYLDLSPDIRARAEEIAGNNRPVTWPEVLLLVGQAIADERERNIPNGWKLVPAEPTPEMFQEMWNAMFEGAYDGTDDPMIGACWDAALLTAPAPPETEREAME